MEKEIIYGGGFRTCDKCGELINGSKIHRCKEENLVSKKITESTKQSGYSVYIPEEAKKQETITWDNIWSEYVKIYTNPYKRDFENFTNWLKENYNVPTKK
jgi:hypothetical protein